MTQESKVSARLILSERPVRTVIAVTFVMMIGFGLIAPTLPLYARSFGVGYAAAGLLLSAFGLTRLATDLVAGQLVDRFGERVCASLGLIFLGLCALLTALAPTYSVALIAWGAGGAGSAIAFAALYSYLLRVVPKSQMGRTLGLFYGSFNAGVIAGSPLGGWIAERYGLASPLFVNCALLVCAGLLYARLVPQAEARGRVWADDIGAARRARAAIAQLFRIRGFVTAIVLNLAYLWMVLAVYDTLVPLFGRDALHLSTSSIGTALAIAIATELVVLYPAGAIADRLGRKAVLVPSFAALAVMVVALGFSSSFASFAVLMALLGITSGVAGVPPAAVLSDVIPEERSGTAVGVFRFCGDLGFFLGPALAGAAVTGFGFRAAFGLVALPLVLALVLTLRTPETLASYRKKNDTAMMR